MDRSTSLMTSMRITAASGLWLRISVHKRSLNRAGFYDFIAFINVCFCDFSYCENGSMHCSAPEMPSFLSDLFYDDETVPSRGITVLF